jgi:hypothetical protein
VKPLAFSTFVSSGAKFGFGLRSELGQAKTRLTVRGYS